MASGITRHPDDHRQGQARDRGALRPQLRAGGASWRRRARTEELEAIRRISDLANIHFVWQKELNGLGDAVSCARHHVGNEPFAVLLGDTLVESARAGHAAAASRSSTATRSPWWRWRRCEREQGRAATASSRASAIADGPLPDRRLRREAVAGGGAVEPGHRRPLRAARPRSSTTSTGRRRGKNNEIQLTDAMRLLVPTRAMYGLRFEGSRYDIGNKLDFIKTNVIFALKRPDMREEVAAFVKDVAARL